MLACDTHPTCMQHYVLRTRTLHSTYIYLLLHVYGVLRTTCIVHIASPSRSPSKVRDGAEGRGLRRSGCTAVLIWGFGLWRWTGWVGKGRVCGVLGVDGLVIFWCGLGLFRGYDFD
ncbi:unnamed protein product [Penicillium nalgiovense]|uniref:Uncharacterized protein n=1 Tax=Penicillium nalgiovense TaxID=60175 RepID=A0A9W4IK76_PENNA|nr:unnamed protein product [Penicillium nalgiovense]CAG7979402.1 unnamed protein product [Penicillium nalgiovense]CAG7985727.1 unnamed protein product [Penicillium nalgiovense]CAG7991510.1 unnamed protein product [Penicillium nalgiovense]CAG7992169.1 unnamed protein product [Penicillium nalgiovense]